VIEASRRTSVAKLLFVGSSGIYPRLAPQPVAGSCLPAGPLEPTIRTTTHIATLLRHTRDVSISRASNPLNLNIVFASDSIIF
jgi:hypothetical protein